MYSSPHHVRAFSETFEDQRPVAQPRPDRRGSPLPAPQALASEISHVIRLLDTSTTATNVAIPTSGFQCLKDVRGNYVRDCWETMTLTSFPRSQSRGTACEIVGKPRHNDRRHRSPQHTAKPQPENRPRPRRNNRTNQMRKGSFFTRPRSFHQVPSPSVSPALVSGMRIRTSA